MILAQRGPQLEIPRTTPLNFFFRLLWFASAVCYLALIVSEVIEFTVWSQILLHPRVGVLDLNPLDQRHALRYALLLPTLELADILDVDVDRIFSLEVGLIILLIPWLIDRSRAAILGDARPWGWQRFALTVFFAVLSLFMNGRMTFGLLAVAILVWALAQSQAGKMSVVRLVLTMAMSLFLASVSTGVFTVVFAAILLWSQAQLLRKTTSAGKRWGAGIACALLLAVAFPLVGIYSTRNLEFHGGVSVEGFWNMLAHGAGKLFLQSAADDPLLFLLFLAPVLGLIGLCIGLTFRYPAVSPAMAPLTCSLMGGLFGYSTLASGIPALVALVLWGTGRRHRQHQSVTVAPPSLALRPGSNPNTAL